jgi:signal transduction histidine kinase
MDIDPNRSVEAVSAIALVPAILDTVCRITGMGFAAVACVTDQRWIACSVQDEIAFGLTPGSELELESTICHEIRQSRVPVVIPDVGSDPHYCRHHTPAQYGFKSYISFPILLPGGQFFGTLCAIDPEPRNLDRDEVRNIFRMFAELIGFHLQQDVRLVETQADLGRERETGIQREQFIAVLGHDLRNPLAALDAGVSMLRRSPAKERVDIVLDAMQATIDRMNVMVGNILDFARGRLVGDLPLRLAPVPVDTLVSQIVSELTAAHPDRAIDLRCPCATLLMCDGQRIGQLVSNLLGNALTHGAPGKPIAVECGEAAGEFLLSVTNHGAEIPADIRERLFQPFERGAGDRSPGGLGLGLYIASTIANAHGGHIEVESSPGETRFTLNMPVDSDARV